MKSSILSLRPDVVDALEKHTLESSTAIAPLLTQHYEWTQKTFADGDRSSSLLQAQWMMNYARLTRPKRVLDIGCYTGLSAIAFYAGTKDTKAKIHTIEKDHDLAEAARSAFLREDVLDRVEVLEGSADDILKELCLPYDLIFVDLEFSAYLPVVKQIIDSKLLSPTGSILVDNVFARGFAVSNDETQNLGGDDHGINHWIKAGELVRLFNQYVASHPRLEVTIYPFFDGVSEIQWRRDGE